MAPSSHPSQPPSSVVEIVAQVRFPPLLTISTAPPAAFQERVRAHFPAFGLSQDRQAYVFQTARQHQSLTLTTDALALVVRFDEGWEAFKVRWAGALQALHEIYRPQYSTRVGLRIRHVIRRSAYGLAEVEWNALLHPHLAATCAWPELGGEVQTSRGEFVIALQGAQDRLRVGHGLLLVEGPRGDRQEVCFLVDHDLYVEAQLPVGEVLGRLDRFHWEARRVFRHCLTERLAKAMDPTVAVEERAA